MTLSEMRRALETTSEEVSSNECCTSTPDDHYNTRLPPDSRGVKESRSSIIEVDLSSPETPNQRKGTLTFANSVRELRRAGSSRGVESGDKPTQRVPPRRVQSCMQGASHVAPLESVET